MQRTQRLLPRRQLLVQRASLVRQRRLDPRMRHIRKPRRIRSLLPKPRLRSTQRALLSQQKKRPIQKNGDNSSKPDYFHETARSTCCEPLSCVPGLPLPPNFRFLRLAQCQAHRFSLALKVDLQDC